MDLYSLSSHIMVFLSLYFEVFFLFSYLSRDKQDAAHDETFTPAVSVIIPCFNEEKSAVKTIQSVLALDYPQENIQIIFVDDGSTDNTLATVTEAFKGNPQVEVYHKENGGKYTALNFGLEKVRHAFIGSLDADSFVDPKSLRIIMQKFRNPKVMATIPATIIHEPKTFVQKAQKAEYHYSAFMQQVLSHVNSVFVTPGPFSFFRKEVFDIIGKYKHAYNTEDMEIAMRMQAHGMKIAHAEKALIYTLGPNTIKKLYRQRVRWAGGFIGNLKDYRKMFFKAKHGDLSLVVLPYISIATVSMLIFGLYTAWRIGHDIYREIVRLSIVGFSFERFNPLEWIYLNTSALAILSLFLILYAIIALVLGNKITHGKAKFNFEFFHLMILYPILYPLWILKAAYNSLISKTAPWR